MSMTTLLRTISRHKRFLISTHENPDPDALCSELAVAAFLRGKGKSVTIVNHGVVPRRYAYLKGTGRIRNHTEAKNVQYDAAVIVDCGELSRIGSVRELLAPGKPVLNIDHHITNDRFGTVNCVYPKASSTAEVLYEILKKGRARFNKDLAVYLYTGIMTDTGSFRYENTTARTHAIVADLMRFKIGAAAVYAQLYETISPKDLAEFSRLIARFKLELNKKVATIDLTRATLAKFSTDFDLRDTIFKFLRTMKTTEVFVIFTEAGRGKTRVNFRSNKAFDVARLANRFGGGGHKRASGCLIAKSIPQARRAVLKEIKKAL